MATVMSWGNSDGVKGRCDAKCHNAVTPHCDCMCGGRYHGTARNGTFEQVREEHGEAILAAAEYLAAAKGFVVDAPLRQPPLLAEMGALIPRTRKKRMAKAELRV